MNTALLAVVVILALLLGLVLIILNSLASTAGTRIRADMARLLTSYDRLIDRKSSELTGLQKQVEEERRAREIVRLPQEESGRPGDSLSTGASIPGVVSYRPIAFRGSYSAIKESFCMEHSRREELLNEVERLEAQELDGRGDVAAELLESLSFDTVFRLSRLTSEEQLELLDTTLRGEDWVLLRDFCEIRRERVFDVASFYEWLEELSALEPRGLTVRCGNKAERDEDGIEYSPEICEGVQIVSGNRLYDYSIKEREIG